MYQSRLSLQSQTHTALDECSNNKSQRLPLCTLNESNRSSALFGVEE
jgi:hypothetical protein